MYVSTYKLIQLQTNIAFAKHKQHLQRDTLSLIGSYLANSPNIRQSIIEDERTFIYILRISNAVNSFSPTSQLHLHHLQVGKGGFADNR